MRDAADIIIVGGGTTGAVLASRLSENPSRSILLFEAGGGYTQLEDMPLQLRRANVMATMLPGSDTSWPMTGDLTSKVHAPILRARLLGGGSAANGTYFIRGIAEDFARWAAAGNEEWCFEKVLPFFQSLEHDQDYGGNFHGRYGPIQVKRPDDSNRTRASEAFIRGCMQLGFPYVADKNAPGSVLGVGPIPLNNINGDRASTATAYLGAVRHRSNLKIRLRTFVRRIVFNGRRAVGVEIDCDGARETVYAREIVLSAGAVKSAHLLLLSGIGPADELAANGVTLVNHLPGVGKNFSDHASTYVTYLPSRSLEFHSDTAFIEAVLHYTASNSNSISDMEILCCTMPGVNLLTGRAAGLSPLRALAPTLRHPIRAFKALEGVNINALARNFRAMRRQAFLVSVMDQDSRGNLRLASSDPMRQPEINFHFFSEETDRRRMREAIRLAVKIMHTKAFSPYFQKLDSPCDDELWDDDALDQWMLRNPVSPAHMTGTCKMGRGHDNGAVVDQYARVHGVDGLRVADLSIIPHNIRRGPAATAVMIGERVAEFYSRIN